MTANKPTNIDEYIAGFPKNIQIILEQLRTTIRKAAPGAEEVISYQMPAFKLSEMLVYFAGYKNHIGFYPTLQQLKRLKKNYLNIKVQKVRFNSRSTNHFHLNL